MSRSNEPSPVDPDDTPTRIGGNAGGGAPGEDPTVPSMQKGGAPAPKQQQPKPAPGPKVNDPLVGKELGGCRITGLLGRGAMGAVYKARQLRLDRDVAVKVIRPEMMTDARTLKRFEVEARTVGRFNSAHVVMVHDVGFEQGVHYLVMEFVQGKNLRDHVKMLAGGRLPAAEAIPLLRQACKGLEEAQRLSVIHRDIKPDNLMLTDRGILKIADFGIAKPIQEDFSMTLTSELIGTPLYMSPEQCQGASDLDFRSDMYSLGATFYYLLTGEPPVRASSVYELIQTKTKLENLCLWKALPELDQNHPLSRVIERMTALDRDDRYESYEALLNDIVIVEQGGTVQRIAPKPKKEPMPTLEVGAPQAKTKGVLVAAVAVIAVAAAGAWFALHGDDGKKPGGTGGATNVPSGSDAVARGALRELSTRLQGLGPTKEMRDELAALTVTGPEAAMKTTLLAAVDQGLGIRDRLAKVKAPTTVQPPFDEIGKHFADVEAAVKVDGALSPLLQQWVATTAKGARLEETLGARALASLSGAWNTWRDDRAKVRGDKDKIAALTERLAVIERARLKLYDLLPGLRADLDGSLSAAVLKKARDGLGEDSTEPVEIDVSDVLAEVRAAFAATGPDESLTKRVSEQRPTKPEQAKECRDLIDELANARARRTNAEDLRTGFPRDPQVPFDDVASYFQRLDLALEPLQDAEKKLPPWAVQLRVSLRDEATLRTRVIAACGDALASWKRAKAEPGADRERLSQRLSALAAGKVRALELFPDAAADLDRVVPAADLDAGNAELAQAAGRQRWFATSRDLIARIEALRTIAEWRAAGAQLSADLAASDQGAAVFAGDAEVQREQKRIGEARGRWEQADAKVKDVAAKIAAADLGGADTIVRAGGFGNEGKEEIRILGEAAAHCRAAFDALDQRLDVAAAVKSLADAKAVLAPVVVLAPAVDQRIATWSARLDALQQAASGMVVIPAGRVRQAAGRVDSFFLSPTEVTHGEFVKFLGELKAAVKGIDDPAKKLAAVEARLPGVGMTADALEVVLGMDPRQVNPRMPADRLTWYAAAAFAAWYGRALPKGEEWALAAFGDGNKQKYPFGAPWDSPQRDMVFAARSLALVDEAGLSWRAAEGAPIHHLAGNVAEWLAAPPDGPTAAVAGGKFNDAEPKARDAAEGTFVPADKSDGRLGFGARTMLRPRTFPGLDWPR
ncbi:MAG: protein kinase [Planctomycetes bacterium]|nr:protein kinase [Planctomycetota bacterium]